MNPAQVLIACALQPEAAPIIDALDLTPGPRFGSVRLFGLDSQTPLCVTGIGSTASATALGLARGQLSPTASPSFLNVGVCGHSSLAQGQAFLAHQVWGPCEQDAALYPMFCARPGIKTDCLHTRSSVERLFGQAGGYDMEGYSFLSAALRFASAEQCALLKVVSDGPGQHRSPQAFKLEAKTAKRLIADQLPAIQRQITQLLEISQALHERSAPSPYFEEVLALSRFSQAQEHRLRRLLQQWDARFPSQTPDLESFSQSAQAGLDSLQEALSEFQALQSP